MSVREANTPKIKAILNIPEDEPVFLLRAQDVSSVETLYRYIFLQEVPGNDPSFLEELRRIRNEFEDWQVKNSDKVKRAD